MKGGEEMGSARTAREVFESAVELKDGLERRAYVERECRGALEVKREVEELLRAHDDASDFMALEGEASNVSLLGWARRRTVSWEDSTDGQRWGAYRIGAKLGEGAVGLVYAAEDASVIPAMPVAVKVLKPGMDSRRILARFELERRVLQRMNHPDIARVLDAGMSPQGRPYFVMERVEGRPLVAFCDEERLGLRQRIQLMIRICRAVEHAHQRGIIHRDLKPSNILVRKESQYAFGPKIIDFGISKVLHGEWPGEGEGESGGETLAMTATQGGFLGTPAYMSPEQASDTTVDIDTRADVYALGVLLYELLVGKPPLDTGELLRGGMGLEGLRRRIRLDEPIKPSARLDSYRKSAIAGRAVAESVQGCLEWREQVKGDLDWIVLRAISKDRNRRYPTVGALAVDLERHLGHEPVEARPPDWRYVAGRFVRRNRWMVFSAGVLGLLLVVGLMVTGWQWRRAVESEHVQNQLRERAEWATLQARIRAYAADMKLASLAMEAGHLGRARSLLEQHEPAASRSGVAGLGMVPGLGAVGDVDLRGLEWHWIGAAVRGGELASFDQQRIVTSVRGALDSSWLAASSFQGDLLIWGLGERRLLHRFPGSPGRTARQGLDLTRDGKRLAYAGTNGLEVIHTDNWQVEAYLKGETSGVEWSPDGGRLAVLGSRELRIHRFPGLSLERTLSLGKSLRGGEGEVHWVGEKGEKVMVMEDRQVRIWNCEGGEPLTAIVWKGDEGWTVATAVDPSGRWLAQGSQSGRVRVVDWVTGREACVVKAHNAWVMDMEFSADSRFLVTGGGDQLAKLWSWDSEKGELLQVGTFQGHQNEVWSVGFTPDGKGLMTGGKDATVKWWGLESGRATAPTVIDPPGLKEPLGFSEDGRYFQYRAETDALRFWAVQSNAPALADVEVPKGVNAEEFWRKKSLLSRGRRAVMGEKGEMEIRIVPQGGLVSRSTLNPVPSALAQLSPDATWVVGVSLPSREAGVWDARTGERRSVLEGYVDNESIPRLNRFAFSPQSTLIAYPIAGFRIQVFDLVRGRPLGQLVGHAWHLYSLRFAPDGKLLVSSSWDGTVGLWNVAECTLARPLLKGHFSGVLSAHFSPDSRSLISFGGEGNMKVWHVETGMEVLSMAGIRPDTFNPVSPSGRAVVWRERDQPGLRMVSW